MVEPGGRERATLKQGDYVRILAHAHDRADGNPPFGMVGESPPVGGLLVAQAALASACSLQGISSGCPPGTSPELLSRTFAVALD